MQGLKSTAYERFTQTVYPSYHWQDWLTDKGRRVLVRRQDGRSWLYTPAGIEATWRHYQERKKQTGPILGPVLRKVNTKTLRIYRPMEREHALLYRTFAEIDYKKPQAIQKFVSQYGLLGLPNRPTEGRVVGESHLDWAREILVMRRAIGKKRSRDYQSLVNEHLRDVYLQIEEAQGSSDTLEWCHTQEPRTLLAALWLQASREMVGDMSIAYCDHCQKEFDISRSRLADDLPYYADRRGRSDQKYCSDKCRQARYDARVRTAKKLLEAGKPIVHVATKTETPIKTVKKWAKKTKKKRSAR